MAIWLGRGDPTWNDGEEIWGPLSALVLTGFAAPFVLLAWANLEGRVRPRTRRVVTWIWLTPALVIHLLMATTILSPLLLKRG